MSKLITSEAFAFLINNVPAIDVHTHLNAAHLGARGLHDILLYHMVISDLYCAGGPDGNRLSDEPGEDEITGRIERAIPFLPLTENTSCYYLMRTILTDLYDWHDKITSANWRTLDKRIRDRAAKTQWPYEVFKKSGVLKAGTESALSNGGSHDDLLFYALEWAFLARMQWGVFDAPLFELEYAWQQDAPSRPLPIGLQQRPAVARQITTVADVRRAVAHYCGRIPTGVLSTAQHLSTDIDYRLVTDNEMQRALDNRADAGPEEMNVYAAYSLEMFLTQLGKSAKPIIFQFSFGAEPLPFETGSRLHSKTIAQLAAIISRHPRVHFQCFLASRYANQGLCTLCRELPNLSLAGYWWHNFFTAIIPQIIEERLDMLSLNKQVGFFSDAYCVEWMYAKSKLVRNLLGEILFKRVAAGRYDVDTALEIATQLLRETPRKLLGV